MKRHLTQCLLVVAALVLAGFVGLHTASAQTAEPVKLRVRITDNGFDDKAEGWSISVEQGQLVELTFVWDQKVHMTDEHIFLLDGYNLEWKQIDANNREATQRFVADKPGAFRIKCDLECEVHDRLKNGTLNVTRRGSGPAVGGADTRAKPQLGAVAPLALTIGDAGTIKVTAVDPSGKPIVGGAVRLVEVVGFMGTPAQEVAIDLSYTGKDGVAQIAYDARRVGDRVLKVYFDGDATNAPGSLDLKLKVNQGALSAYQVEPPTGIPGVNRMLVSGVLIIVWGTMFIVAAHVIALARVGSTEAEQEAHRGQ